MGNCNLRSAKYVVWFPRYSGGEPTGKMEQHRGYVCYSLARNEAIHMGAILSRVVDGAFGPVVLDGAALLRERAKKGVVA